VTKTRIIVMSDEGLPVNSFGPYESIQIDGGVVFMRDDVYEPLDRCYKIPDGYTIEFVYETEGGFDQ